MVIQHRLISFLSPAKIFQVAVYLHCGFLACLSHSFPQKCTDKRLASISGLAQHGFHFYTLLLSRQVRNWGNATCVCHLSLWYLEREDVSRAEGQQLVPWERWQMDPFLNLLLLCAALMRVHSLKGILSHIKLQKWVSEEGCRKEIGGMRKRWDSQKVAEDNLL